MRPGSSAALACAILLVGLLWPMAGWSDGGAVYLSRALGGLRVSLFGPPLPLTPGAADLSVMVQDARDLHPILDARVALVLSEAARPGSHRVALSHARAADKLLYAGSVVFTRPGSWTIRLQVAAQGRDLETSFPLTVAAGGTFSQVWPYLAAVPLIVFLFGWNQWLAYRQRGQATSLAAS